MQEKIEYPKNYHSGLAKQHWARNWSITRKKSSEERLTILALKSTCINKGKLSVVGKNFRDLKPKVHERTD